MALGPISSHLQPLATITPLHVRKQSAVKQPGSTTQHPDTYTPFHGWSIVDLHQALIPQHLQYENHMDISPSV